MKNFFFLLGYLLTFGYYFLWAYHPIITLWPFNSLWLMSVVYFFWITYLIAMDKFVVGNKTGKSPSFLWVLYYPGYLIHRRQYQKNTFATMLGVMLNIFTLVMASVWLGVWSYRFFH
ncbi:hypothetical protein CENTIMANUS_00296 [Klebsiella phage vB_KpM_Centimanus]